MRRRWVYINGEAIPAESYEAVPQADYHVMGDISPYQSMVDGSMIESRSAHREHLRRHALQEVGNDTSHLRPQVNLKGTGQKQAVIEAVQRAKEQHGSRYVERSITESLQRAHEMSRHRR